MIFPLFQKTGQAYNDLIDRYGWESVTILYEDNNSMKRLKAILERTSQVKIDFLVDEIFLHS